MAERKTRTYHWIDAGDPDNPNHEEAVRARKIEFRNWGRPKGDNDLLRRGEEKRAAKIPGGSIRNGPMSEAIPEFSIVGEGNTKDIAIMPVEDRLPRTKPLYGPGSPTDIMGTSEQESTGLKKGGKVKAKAKAAAPKKFARGGGIEVRGKTRGKMC